MQDNISCLLFKNQLILSKENIKLVSLTNEHMHALAELATNEAIWKFAPGPYYQPDTFQKEWFNKAIKQMQNKDRVCLVIFFKDKIAGSSSYYEIDLENKKTTIGYTWFHPSTWGTIINPLTKLIMLEYAFEILQLNRVGFSVDSTNERSCRALEKLGVQYEGTLRNHLVLPNKRIRHSNIFSVIKSEWPETKKRIEALIRSF